jgi:hypothetical protein
VAACRRTGDRCGPRPRHRLGRRGEDRLDERTLALIVVPRMEMVRDPQRLESGTFCHVAARGSPLVMTANSSLVEPVPGGW